jgi:hypothetical protein
MIRALVYIIFILLLNSCGYKPVAYFAQNNIKSVYVQIVLNPKYPDNFSLSKNKIISLINDKFHIKVEKDKKKANTIIKMKIVDIKFTPIEYKNGFIEKYRTSVSVKFSYTINKILKTKTIKAKYDFKTTEATLYTKLLINQKSLSVNYATLLTIEQFIASIIYKQR